MNSENLVNSESRVMPRQHAALDETGRARGADSPKSEKCSGRVLLKALGSASPHSASSKDRTRRRLGWQGKFAHEEKRGMNRSVRKSWNELVLQSF